MKSSLFQSLKFKLLTFLALVFTGLMLVVVINNAIAYSELKKNIYQVTMTNIGTLQSRLDDLFSMTENHLINFTLDNSDIFIIERGDLSQSDWFSAKYRLTKSFNTTTTTYNLDGSFLFSTTSHTFLSSTSTNLNTTISSAINSQIETYITTALASDSVNNREWFLLPDHDIPVIIRLLKINNSYIGSWVTIDNLLDPLVGDNNEYIYLADKTGRFMTSDSAFSAAILNHAIDSHAPQSLSVEDTTYMAVETSLEAAPFLLVSLIPESQYNLDIQNYMPVLIIAIVLVVIFLIAILWMINHLVIHPLDQLHNGIHALSQGDLDQRLPQNMNSSEFKEINNTFNDMLTEINTLKISVYEEQLAKQDVQMDYLSLQIAPHFLINAISLSYQLAEMGKHDLTKQMLHDLSIHLRYTLSQEVTVTLEEELRHVRNYISLSLIRYPDAIVLFEDIDPDTLDCSVIPLLLQSFVENTIKYEVVTGKVMGLHISTSLIQGRDRTYLSITFWDTGRGYDPVLLKRLQNLRHYIEDKSSSHYGIRNVVQRTWMVYGPENCAIHFSNRPKAGAQMELMVPYIPTADKGKIL